MTDHPSSSASSGSPSPDDLDFGPTVRGFREGLRLFGGRFELLRVLGRGGMGVVWLARDRELERRVALKFLPETMIHDEEAIADLKEETRRCMGLTHPHIVRVFDFLREREAAAVSMEYVEGPTLQQAKLEREGRCFDPRTIAPWIGQVCEALTYAHGEGRTVHRDLKPANVMVEAASGRAKLTDFGIAGTLTDSMTRLTRGGMPASGTLVYMSPQQAMGYPPSVGDDVYALGATIYELLTGKPPFYRGEILQQINHVEAPSMAERRRELGLETAGAIPAAWEETVAACLAKEVGDRPASVAALWAGLEGRAGRPERPAGEGGGKGEGKTGTWPKAEAKAEESREEGRERGPGATRPDRRKVALLGLGALAAVMLGAWAVGNWGGDDPKDAESAAGQGAEVAPAAAPAPMPPAPSPAPMPAAPQSGTLAIGSEPAGATILVEGEAIGTTTTGGLLSHRLEAGTYEIEARYRSWPVQRRTVEVAAGRSETVAFTFEPVAVRVESEPAGAEVREEAGGKVLGVTPLVLAKEAGLEPGKVGWKLSLAGHEPGTWSGTLAPGSNGPVSVRLAPLPMPAPPTGTGTGAGDLTAGAIGDSRAFDLGGGKKLVMKYVPGGTFTMGSPEDEEDRDEDEAQVEVTLSRHFWLGETEVTQGQWEAVMGPESNPSEFTGDETLPVESVSWEEAQAFVAKLNEKGGLPAGWAWSLPTEAQWERACRAGTETVFSFGDSLGSEQANFDGDFPYGGAAEGPYLEKTAPVKSYEANGWGLYDMHGNVYEWCLDSWDGETKLPGGVDPVGTTGSLRVSRGGGWSYFAGYCRSANRLGSIPVARHFNLGFRVALSSLPGRGAAGGGGGGQGAGAPAGTAGGGAMGGGGGGSKGSGGVGAGAGAVAVAVAGAKPGPIAPGKGFTSGVGTAFVWVEPGEFVMGSSEAERAALMTPEEGEEAEYLKYEPAHRVRITKGYWVGAHEVTIGDYVTFLNESGQWDEAWVALDEEDWRPIERGGDGRFRMREGKGMTWGDERLPMVGVSWDGAMAYGRWLTAEEAGRLPAGYRYTLPSEAEWEKACRAGTTTMTYAGDLAIKGEMNAPELDGIAWYGGNSGLDHPNGADSSDWEGKQYPHTSAGTHPVGMKEPNGIGAYDLIGNVWEWCRDRYGEDYYDEGQVDPEGPPEGSYRVFRGGSWFNLAWVCRAARRGWYLPSYRDDDLGFRVALSSLPGE